MCRNIIVCFFSIILCDDNDLQMAKQIIDDQRQALPAYDQVGLDVLNVLRADQCRQA